MYAPYVPCVGMSRVRVWQRKYKRETGQRVCLLSKQSSSVCLCLSVSSSATLFWIRTNCRSSKGWGSNLFLFNITILRDNPAGFSLEPRSASANLLLCSRLHKIIQHNLQQDLAYLKWFSAVWTEDKTLTKSLVLCTYLPSDILCRASQTVMAVE